MTELSNLYRRVILEHNRHPRNAGRLECPTHRARAANPLCGDEYELYLDISRDGVIRDARFDGHGCAVSRASASLMTEAVKGKTASSAATLVAAFRDVVNGNAEGTAGDGPASAALRAFAGIHEFPSRVSCAFLCWQALSDALGVATETEAHAEPGSEEAP